MSPWLLAFLTFIIAIVVYRLLKHLTRPSIPLPPGPRPWPIVGNFPHLGRVPHHALAALARTYGPIMHLRLGLVDVVVAASASVAEQFLKVHDANFASRPPSAGGKYVAYNYQDIVLAPYGPRWRLLRKISSVHLFSGKALEDSRYLRQEEVGRLTRNLASAGSNAVNLGQLLYVCTTNAMGRSVIGRRVFNDGGARCDPKAEEFKNMIAEVMVLSGAFNIGDFVPALEPLDLQGVQGKMKKLHNKFDAFLSGIIREHKVSESDDHKYKDMLSTLLSLKDAQDCEADKLTDTEVKALLLNMFVAGTDTTASTIEWGIAELIRHPRILAQAQQELDSVVGRDRLVSESDFPKLPYLQAIVKETFRLHPSTPLSLPRIAAESCEIHGYHIPKGATLLVNVWGIGRDPKEWSNPLEFKPERFLPGGEKADVDVKGNDFEVIPFGAGRRICAGMNLGVRMVQLLTATLAHAFDWELKDGLHPEKLNMDEAYGLTLQRAAPLVVHPRPRLSPQHIPIIETFVFVSLSYISRCSNSKFQVKRALLTTMSPWLLALATFIVAILVYRLLKLLTRPSLPLPPGPRPWPIVGNFPHLGRVPHHALAALARTYGPLMHLRLGVADVVVAASASVAEQFLKVHDANFASRPPSAGGKYVAYNYQDLVLAPYGPRWRLLRKISSVHLFSGKALEDSRYLRQEEVGRLTRNLASAGSNAVNLGQMLYVCTTNALGRVVIGRRVFNDVGATCDPKAEEFKNMIVEVMVLSGAFNIGDFVPALEPLDLQGVQGKMKKLHNKFDAFFTSIIKEHKASKSDHNKHKDMLSTLLSLIDAQDINEADKLTETENMFVAGTDTSASTIEWAIAELIRHPRILAQVQQELDSVVGRDRLVSESDLPKLPYFQAFVKETFRLHPATPLSLPRVAAESCEIYGYHIPKGATLLMNVWAIGRDPKEWSDPLEFKPERFLPGGEKADVDVRGNDFEVIPFGAGRRICAGMTLGIRMVQLLTATLAHAFDWDLKDGLHPEKLNMDEAYGLTLQRAAPLVVHPKSRLSPLVYLSESA
ncbi:flavonoid 3'-monooxygenase [Senna tora]|uniref:Flavonoid 3'-monooxygenase n=1 Tax=Senna tora TaxID=362788 RepID=A0A834SZC8_9FABA|nr:flavonoid 3'-monooxygenase [Senna tora]